MGKVIKKADLYNAINIGDNFTCFVADNDAVALFIKENGYSSVDDLSEDIAKELMKYHIISGGKEEDAKFTGKLDNQTLSGDNLTIK
ncbi:MAG: fasciclin domain-containing protein, partial [Odoribacter sp.]|nr:fasciclin domain-containing protein [Odoribacter sp.]